jgi:hypothetical protein
VPPSDTAPIAPYLFAPDILAEGRGLSPWISGVILLVGLILWLWGARTHRFWVAVGTTLVAGWLGLTLAPQLGMQPLVAGLLLAVSGGALSLSLVRLLLFVTGGGLAHLLCQRIAPGWEPLACFLAGGLACILLYQFCITVLTSLAGTLLMGYAGLWLADLLDRFDAVAWTGKNAPLLNWACLALVVTGVLVQYLLERRRSRKAEAGTTSAGGTTDEVEEVGVDEDDSASSWLGRWRSRLSGWASRWLWPFRKAA